MSGVPDGGPDYGLGWVLRNAAGIASLILQKIPCILVKFFVYLSMDKETKELIWLMTGVGLFFLAMYIWS